MSRSVVSMVVVAALTCLGPVALAEPGPKAQQVQQEEGHLSYPASAADFRAHVGHREDRARARMERYIVDAQVTKQKADEIRARFQVAIAQIDAKVDEVCADGTVTEDEARSVHALAKALRQHAHDS